MSEITSDILTSDILVNELRRQREAQNMLMARDTLPHPLEVKTFFLQLCESTRAHDFRDVGVSVFSQNNEDGILLYILSVVGMKTRTCVEVGCDLSASTIGIPEANTINLLVNFGFDGLIIDMDEGKMASIRHFFSCTLQNKHFHLPRQGDKPARQYSPSLVTAELSPENIDEVLSQHGFTGEVDVYSQDFDGPDVMAWQKLTAINPRVVVIEVNNRLAFDVPVYGSWTESTAPADTLEYQASIGSSLAAACEVASERGYVFVGMNNTLINAFFVRRDIWSEKKLPERKPQDYLNDNFNVLRRISQDSVTTN